MLVRAALDEANYTLVEARDGDEALARTRSEHPDLILLDMVMPGCSGSDVLSALRRDPATAATPVIVLTARAQAADRQAMLHAGADQYFTKPFSPHALASLIGQLMGDPVAPSCDQAERRRGLIQADVPDITSRDASAEEAAASKRPA